MKKKRENKNKGVLPQRQRGRKGTHRLKRQSPNPLGTLPGAHAAHLLPLARPALACPRALGQDGSQLFNDVLVEDDAVGRSRRRARAGAVGHLARVVLWALVVGVLVRGELRGGGFLRRVVERAVGCGDRRCRGEAWGGFGRGQGADGLHCVWLILRRASMCVVVVERVAFRE